MPPTYFFEKKPLNCFQNKIKAQPKIALFLDFDGTLVPIRKDPKQCFLSDRAKNQIQLLARSTHCCLTILSGRSLSDITKRVGIRGIYYGGNHGLDILGPNVRFTHPKAITAKPVIDHAKRRLKKKIADIDGAWLEDKKFTISLHFRSAGAKDIPRVKKVFYDVAEEFLKKNLLSVIKGKKVMELVPRVSWDKGKAALWILQRLKNKCLPIYVGDDNTDENAFKALSKKGITICIGRSKKTAANLYLKRQGEILKFLKESHGFITK